MRCSSSLSSFSLFHRGECLFKVGFKGLFMSEVEFKSELSELIPEKERNWALFDTQNKLYNFDEFTGKPIVLSFWATWCPPCRAELPELQELKNEMKGSDSCDCRE
jgi:thiol-disulfide isomerase/thioredoxin